MVGDKHHGLAPKVAVSRKILWESADVCIFELTPQRSPAERVRSGKYVGNPYVPIVDTTLLGLCGIPAFLHGDTVEGLKKCTSKQKPVLCKLQIAESTFPSGSVCVSFDYRLVPEAVAPTHWLRVVKYDVAHDAEVSGMVGVEQLALSVATVLIGKIP